MWGRVAPLVREKKQQQQQERIRSDSRTKQKTKHQQTQSRHLTPDTWRTLTLTSLLPTAEGKRRASPTQQQLRHFAMFTASALVHLARTLIKYGVGLASSVAVLSLAALYIFQRKLVYPSYLNEARVTVDTPDKFDIPYESIDINTSDGEILQSYLMLHDIDDVNYTNKTVLILSPNAGNIGMFLPVVNYIYRTLNYNVFIYSYRGYGKSTGSPSERGLKLDADAVMKFISSHKQLSQSSIIAYGRSIGGAVAIYIASVYGHQISALILENTFLNIHKVIPHIFPFLKPVSWMCTEFWNSEEAIKRIRPDLPCLFLAGTQDEIVPPEHMKMLYDLVSSDSDEERKACTVWREFKAHHNDTIVAPGYWETWAQFAKEMVIPVGN